MPNLNGWVTKPRLWLGYPVAMAEHDPTTHKGTTQVHRMHTRETHTK
jgi:hypothetical protein